MIRTIGPHKVTNASIENPIVDQLIAGQKISVFYSDPPWGDGNLKFWATLNKKMTGTENNPLTYSQLLERIMQLIQKSVDGYIFIETGMRWGDIISTLFGQKFHNCRTYKLNYKAGSKQIDNILISAATSPAYQFKLDPSGMTGYPAVKAIVGSVLKPGQIVLDPCCGMGYTARATVEHGGAFRGNEVNAARLQKTIDLLEKATLDRQAGIAAQ